jgi:uncharacterized protein YecE (DUF72 family)
MGTSITVGTSSWADPGSVEERYRYADDELREIEHRVAPLAEQAGAVRVHFNNNRGSDAPVAAQRFRELVGRTAART